MKTLLTALVLTIGSFALSAQAKADCYGSFTLENPSKVAIHYQVKWGDGDWKWYCVQPGHIKYHYYDLDANNQVPTPQVRFDWIAGDDEVTWKTYKMDVYAVYAPSKGKPHIFQYSRCGCYLDLYAKR